MTTLKPQSQWWECSPLTAGTSAASVTSEVPISVRIGKYNTCDPIYVIRLIVLVLIGSVLMNAQAINSDRC